MAEPDSAISVIDSPDFWYHVDSAHTYSLPGNSDTSESDSAHSYWLPGFSNTSEPDSQNLLSTPHRCKFQPNQSNPLNFLKWWEVWRSRFKSWSGTFILKISYMYTNCEKRVQSEHSNHDLLTMQNSFLCVFFADSSNYAVNCSGYIACKYRSQLKVVKCTVNCLFFLIIRCYSTRGKRQRCY